MVRAFCGTLAWRRSMLRLYVHGVHHRPSLYTFLGIIVIPKARHPDVRKASARSHQRASRTEGSCVCLFSNPTVFLKCHNPNPPKARKGKNFELEDVHFLPALPSIDRRAVILFFPSGDGAHGTFLIHPRIQGNANLAEVVAGGVRSLPDIGGHWRGDDGRGQPEAASPAFAA